MAFADRKKDPYRDFMTLQKPEVVLAFLILVLLGACFCAYAQRSSPASLPTSVPTFSIDAIGREGFFYVGGHYVGESGKEVMEGAMYVEVRVPKQIRHQYPIVMIHGAGQTGVDWLQTPDGRSGWAYYLIDQGYVVYIVDTPARGRSAYVPGVDGKLTIRTAQELESNWTASGQLGKWPQAKKYSQWPSNVPNKGRMGDPVFDAFARTQVQYLAGGLIDGGGVDQLNLDADEALLEKIGPAILLTHQQAGSFAWLVADAKPQLVKGIVSIEPPGPPIQNVDTTKLEYVGYNHPYGIVGPPVHYDPPIRDASELQVVLQKQAEEPGLIPCWRQQEPAHKLVNLESIPVLIVSGEASDRRVYVHCTAEWLSQAGVKTTFLRLEQAGISGNSHMMMLEKNSLDIIKILESWIDKNIR